MPLPDLFRVTNLSRSYFGVFHSCAVFPSLVVSPELTKFVPNSAALLRFLNKFKSKEFLEFDLSQVVFESSKH